MLWVFLAIILVVLVSAASPDKKSGFHSSGMTQKEREFADDAYRIRMRGLDAKRASTAEKAVSDYETSYEIAQQETRLTDVHIYEEDLSELRETRDELRREEWYKKADVILDKFFELYEMITSPDFRDVEKAYKSKARCIRYWQEYFYSMPRDDGTLYHPKDHLREMPWYEPCMESHEELEKRLSACITEMKPEYRRKIALRKRMVEEVARNETMLRADLMRACREGYTELELKYCYKELIEKYILAEVKYSNRYIVSLSEKEKEKRQKQSPPDGTGGDRV